MVDAADSSEGWYVHLSVSGDDGGHLLAAAGELEIEGGASLLAYPDSDMKELVSSRARMRRNVPATR